MRADAAMPVDHMHLTLVAAVIPVGQDLDESSGGISSCRNINPCAP